MQVSRGYCGSSGAQRISGLSRFHSHQSNTDAPSRSGTPDTTGSRPSPAGTPPTWILDPPSCSPSQGANSSKHKRFFLLLSLPTSKFKYFVFFAKKTPHDGSRQLGSLGNSFECMCKYSAPGVSGKLWGSPPPPGPSHVFFPAPPCTYDLLDRKRVKLLHRCFHYSSKWSRRNGQTKSRASRVPASSANVSASAN